MPNYPQTIHFVGLNTPVGIEWSARNLDVIGTIPAEIDGAFFRAVPDPAHPPMFDDDIVLSGDGMVAKFAIHDGKVDYAIRYVETERYRLEKDARRALFGQYRNPFTDDASVAGRDRTVANTTPVWHGGRLLMTKEDGLGYQVDPDTLETLGRFDYYGALKSQTFTAHPRVDPETGEMFFFGYEADGLCSTKISYAIADRDGKLISEQWFDQPYCSTIHDFAITEHYAIFPIFPTTADLDRLKAGGAHWAHQQDLESWVGIMPRYGKVEEMRWFKGRNGVSAFHLVNAYEEDGFVHLDLCLSDTNAFGFMREAGGIQRDQRDRQVEGGRHVRGASGWSARRHATAARRGSGKALSGGLVSVDEPARRATFARRTCRGCVQRAVADRTRQWSYRHDGAGAGHGDQRTGPCAIDAG